MNIDLNRKVRWGLRIAGILLVTILPSFWLWKPLGVSPARADSVIPLNPCPVWFSGDHDDTYSIAWGDLDGDGDLDLAVGNRGANKVYLNEKGVLQIPAAWTSNDDDWTWSVAWGDMDGDGDLDLAVGNTGTSGTGASNKVYLNEGGILQSSAVWVSNATESTTSVAWGDMDGDGDLDLVIGNVPVWDGSQYVGGKNQIYLNEDGVLQSIAAWTSNDADWTHSVALGDLDGDGDLDLAVGNGSSSANKVYLNLGGHQGGTTGVLQTVAAWTSGDDGYTSSVAWGDVDGDGDLDLAAGNHHSPNKIYLNINGVLQTAADGPWTSDDGDATNSVMWGDLDGDGDLDLVVGNDYDANKVYLNQNGILQTAADSLWTSSDKDNTKSVAWGDMDGDGDLDVAAGNANAANVVYLNTGGGGRINTDDPWLSEDKDATNSVAWGDVDGDGDLDLVIGNSPRWDGTQYIGGDNKIYLNEGGVLQTSAAWISGDQDRTYSVAWGDVNGDGYLDLAVGNNLLNKVYLNDGTGVLQTAADNPWTSGDYDGTHSVAWGDVDGDGDLDLAAGNTHRNKVYLNEGGILQTPAAWVSDDDDHTASVAWGDVDGDGDLDLVVGNSGTTDKGMPNKIYLNEAGSLQTVAAWISSDSDETYSVAWGDVDGDGDLDLAAGNRDSPNKVYLNDGFGILQSTAAWLSGDSDFTTYVAWGDVDGDGDLDLITGNSLPSSVPVGGANRIYLNDGIGNLQNDADDPWTFADSDVTTSVAWGDVDGDGDLDLIAGNTPRSDRTGGENRGYENTRQGRMASLNNVLSLGVTTPYISSANFYAVPAILKSQTLSLHYTLFDPEADPVGSIEAFYSLNGGGHWLPAIATTDTITTHLSTGYWLKSAVLTPTQAIPNTGIPLYAEMYITDSATVAEVEAWVWITHTQNADLSIALQSPSGMQIPLFTAGQAIGQNFSHTRFSDYVTTTLIVSGTAPYTGTYHPVGNLTDLKGQAINGTWTLVITDSNTLTGTTGTLAAWGLHIKTPPVTHVYTWDTFASGFFGQSDNVVLRMVAYPQPATAAVTGTYKYYNATPGPFQRPYASATTFPFRVRGTQVRVFSETISNTAQNALVYRWNENTGSTLMSNSAGVPFRTDQHGYLQGRGQIGLGDQLLAMLPVSSVMEYAGALTFDGLNDYAIKNPFNNAPITATTVSFWISTTRATGAPVAYASPLTDNTLLLTNPGNLTLWRGNVYSLTTGVTVTDGLWHHLAVTWRSADGGVTVYKDGVLAYSSLPSETLAVGTVIAPGGSLTLGNNQNTDFFEGSLDDVHIWTSARAEAQILNAMTGLLDVNDPHLAASWDFDNPDTPGTDASGNDNTLTLHGASWEGDYLGGYTVYHTNGIPTEDGVEGFTVSEPGVQEVVVSADQPLILFDLNVSLEWDAHNDPVYLQQLDIDLKKASAYLYDFTDGQVALGKVTVYQNADGWANAHIAVQASNRLRPFAHIGGLRTEIVTETVTVDGEVHTLTYGPGQIRMGATWNRYGDPAQSVGVDWPLVLAHELGHYLLYQYDVYIGLDEAGLLVPQEACTGSAMGDVYNLNNTEFITSTLHWTGACSQTLAAQTLGRTEWATLRLHYPWLVTPTHANDGPSHMPFAFTTVEIVSPTTALDTLEDPTFYLDYEGGDVSSSAARAFLLRDAEDAAQPAPDDFEYVYDLGNPTGGQNRVLARGAQPGDRLCVFDRARLQHGCEVIASGDERLALRHDATWTPMLRLSPVNSTTFALQVGGLPTATPGITLNARLFPEFGAAFTPTALSYVGDMYTGTLALPYPVMWGYVQVWGDSGSAPTEIAPRPEIIVSFSIGGNPGFDRVSGGGFDRVSGGGFDRVSGGGFDRVSGGGFDRVSGGGNLRAGEAPLVSPDGQMILYLSDAITFAEGEFYTIQTMAGLPDLDVLPGRALVGPGYNLIATGFASDTDVLTGSVSIQYLGNDVLAVGADEEDLQLYYWDGDTWAALDTVLNTTYNMASAHSQGPGIYALFASTRIALYGPGWNLFSYHVRATQPVTVTEALLSISGYYTTVYGYVANDPNGDPWKVYDITVPDMYRHVVNDLEALEFGKGYWINVSRAITLYLSAPETSQVTRLQDDAGTPASPPDTFYGPVLESANFTPSAGMPVAARIAGAVCGHGVTSMVGDQVVYAVNVWANDDITSNCGDFGDEVTFFVGGQPMRPTATWDNRQLNELVLSSGNSNTYLYLPLVLRAN